MSTPQDGGQAFPCGTAYTAIKGMSLRDWFAGMALQGLLSGQFRNHSSDNFNDLPHESYKIADAMLAARKEQP